MCILMEFAEGGDLSALLSAVEAAARASQSHPAEDEVVDWFVQLAEGLAHPRLKVLHRDLKPRMSSSAEEEEGPSGVTLKIGDFGISRILQASAEMAKTCVGSPCYLSPEIVQGAAYGYKSDVWSLGVIVYRAMTNRFPFDADNLAQLALKITAGSFPPLSPSTRRRRTTSSLPCSRSTRPPPGDGRRARDEFARPARPRPPRAAASGMPLSPAAALTARSASPCRASPRARGRTGPGLAAAAAAAAGADVAPHQLRRRLVARRAVGDAAVGGLKTASPETPLPAAAAPRPRRLALRPREAAALALAALVARLRRLRRRARFPLRRRPGSTRKKVSAACRQSRPPPTSPSAARCRRAALPASSRRGRRARRRGQRRGRCVRRPA